MFLRARTGSGDAAAARNSVRQPAGTRNASPDLGFDRSVNPDRGCEHGCIYCFARPTHAYLDLSPGIDFETKLIAKTNAADQLGPMRPGSIIRQYRNPKERKTPFHQISYTQRMKSRTEYLRKENLKAVRKDVANFKRFRNLVDKWADAAL